jgi:hypothetical protein
MRQIVCTVYETVLSVFGLTICSLCFLPYCLFNTLTCFYKITFTIVLSVLSESLLERPERYRLAKLGLSESIVSFNGLTNMPPQFVDLFHEIISLKIDGCMSICNKCMRR